MSQSPPNYMEGVPVKISEKYKPPPKVSLPQSVCQRLSTDEIPSSFLDYDFSLEQNIIEKICQWKKVREGELENRRQRLIRNELERVRRIEEKEKELLTAVSYPSTEELSSSSDDDDKTTFDGDYAKNASLNKNTSQFSPSQQRFDTILMPTAYNQLNSIKSIKSNASSKINYSDFENDTSSPFDNVELKTINDLDILAQVLNVTQLHSSNDAICNEKTPENNISENLENSNNFYKTVPSAANGNINLVIQSSNNYNPPSSSQNLNNFYTIYNESPENYENMNAIMKNEFCSFNQLPMNENYNLNNYNVRQTDLAVPSISAVALNSNQFLKMEDTEPNGEIVTPAKNKSKSVPDILKELNADIRDSELRRIKNQTVAENTKISTDTSVIGNKGKIDESFLKLSPSAQLLAKNICSMGFPLERVSRIIEKFGDDDKKIVEHLIPLSELLDLGFEESRISEALLKFDNNKEQALDFLIS